MRQGLTAPILVGYPAGATQISGYDNDGAAMVVNSSYSKTFSRLLAGFQLIITVVLTIFCGGTQTSRMINLPNWQPELNLDEKQVKYIEDSVARLFQWDAYWT